ncbi:MAG: phosphoadenylyl-sulfate reductase [Spirochaetales bacterium]|jgi:phosphoadenosine phosphosulfate reductase|nr:phosphoadenylyl-sulfate reductase [Spirochaetales bacterium]
MLSDIKGPIALAFSHQAEDIAVLHLTLACKPESLEVFTLDTGKLFPETLSFHDEAEKFFGISIIKYRPEPDELRTLENKLGPWGMRESLENRHLCCSVRKVIPLQKALKGKTAWITGLRAAQSVTRTDLKIREYDEANGLLKINPIAAWTDEQLSAYIRENGLPIHPLYAKGFKSIGCEPCTRAVKEGEDIRAGRWWWENPEHKECGLHLKERKP